MPLVDLFAEESGEQREQQINELRRYLESTIACISECPKSP